ncbi:hypothetical protein BJX76DRAFT_64401 [Aspergillus varians]
MVISYLSRSSAAIISTQFETSRLPIASGKRCERIAVRPLPVLVVSHIGPCCVKWCKSRRTSSGLGRAKTVTMAASSAGRALSERTWRRRGRRLVTTFSAVGQTQSSALRWQAVQVGWRSSHFFLRRRQVRHPFLECGADLGFLAGHRIILWESFKNQHACRT